MSILEKYDELKKFKKENQPVSIFYYRVLRSSVFFIILWLLILGASVFMFLQTKGISEVKGFVYLMTSIISLIFALQSYDRYGGKYISLYNDRMIIHYSIYLSRMVLFSQVSDFTVENEIAELHTPGETINIPLAHLSFNDQKELIDILDQKMNLEESIE